MITFISIENEKNYQTLFSDSEESVYAVLDGASVPNIIQSLAGFSAESICLYRGELDPELAQVAPYLVLLPPDSELTNWVLNGVGHHWGIFAISKASMKEMRKHFRTFLMVYDPDGQPLYFRYYDPRVLRIFLPTFEEKDEIFGIVERYYAENEVGEGLSVFNRLGQSLNS